MATVLSVAAMLVSACGGAGGQAAGDADEVRLALNNTSASLSAVVAEKKGFFADHGLKITSTVLNDITKIPPTLGKQFDIGFGVQPLLIRAASQGVPLVMISGNEFTTVDKPEILLLTRKDSGIRSAQDLVGKKLGAPTLTGNIHLGTLYWLKTEGVDPKSVTSVQVASPSMIDQLNAGLIDAAEMQQPFISLAKSKGFVEVAYPLGAVGDPAQLSSWQADRTWAAKNGDVIAKFKAALDEARAWMAANEQETRQLLAEHTKLPADVVAGSPLPEFTTETGKASIEQWDKVLRGVTDFAADVNYDELVFLP